MAGPVLPYGSELDVFQENEGRKIMTLKLSKEYFEEEEQGVVEFMKVVVNVNRDNGIDLQEWIVKSMYMTQVYNLYTCTSSMAEGLVKQVNLAISLSALYSSDDPAARKSSVPSLLGEAHPSRRLQHQQSCSRRVPRGICSRCVDELGATLNHTHSSSVPCSERVCSPLNLTKSFHHQVFCLQQPL